MLWALHTITSRHDTQVHKWTQVPVHAPLLYLLFLPDGRMDQMKHVGKHIHELTVFKSCVCVDLNHLSD